MEPSRARIGLILPMDNVVMEPELYALGIPGVSYHTIRLTTKERRLMPEQAIVLAPILVESGVDLIVYACAETSFLGGADDSHRVSAEITAATGLPCVTAVGAMIEALRTLAVHRIALVTPYTAARTQVMQEVLLRYGFETAGYTQQDFSEGHGDSREWYHTNRQPPSVAYEMALRADRPAAEAVVIGATNFRTLAVVEALEAQLGKPVVTTNQAILRAALLCLGISDPIPGMGRLFQV
jgi:maleate isomerase